MLFLLIMLVFRKNPHREIPAKKEDVQQAKARVSQGITCIDATSAPGKPFAGFVKPCPYPHQPLSRYQSWIRGDSNSVTYHYTRSWDAEIVER